MRIKQLRLRHLATMLGLLWAFESNHQAAVAQSRPQWTSSKIQGRPEAPAPYRIAPAFPKVSFTKPTSVQEIPGSNALLVTEMTGGLYRLEQAADVREAALLLDLTSLLPESQRENENAISLFSATCHPAFADNGFIFVCYVHPGEDGHTRVSRLTMAGDEIDPESELVVITWPAGGHNAGCLKFGKDGNLYISTGDGWGPNPPDNLNTGQGISDLLGAVLRIDVDHAEDGLQYSVPKDNPFVDRENARPEIWAYGLRNAWKFGVDPETGDIFVADNGWESWEMVHKIVRGGNCGWPVMEGRAKLRTELPVGPTPIIPPVKDHPHSEANSVIGGPIYRGNKLAKLNGTFVYGDYITGTIWGLRSTGDGDYAHATLVDTDLRIVDLTQSRSGRLYVLDYDYTGQIYELLESDEEDNSANFPRRLSETGLFRSTSKLAPSPGVVPYFVRVSRWLDGALARRWVAIPGDGAATLADSGEAGEYPDGTVFVKQLLMPQAGKNAIRLETQLLHFEAGTWRPYSYVWNDEGTDAVLVDSVGADRPIKYAGQDGLTEQTWHVGAHNECRLCHNAGSNFVLGFVPNQLNLALNATGRHTQLNSLTSQGILTSSDNPDEDAADRIVDPYDATLDLNDRARSYLHVNCSMCHHPRGNAIVSFYLRRDLPFEKLNTNKGTGIGTFGMEDAKLIVGGDPYRSVLMYRMSKLGYGRMPYIGSRVVDSAGIALIADWIKSLPKDGESSSTPLTDGSSDAAALAALTRRDSKPDDRKAAIRQLLKTTSGGLALAEVMHKRSLTKDDQGFAAKLSGDHANSNIRGILETFVPEPQRRARLGPNVDPQTILALTGDVARGKLIFFSDAARCRACHEVKDPAKSVGPTLTEVVKKYPRRNEFLQHVLQPSLKVEDKFAAYTVVTSEGRVLNGLLVEKTDDAIVIKTAEKRQLRIAADDVEEFEKSRKSLMPERILSDLTAQEAADLLAYIRSEGMSNGE